jgi:hypothetical protein
MIGSPPQGEGIVPETPRGGVVLAEVATKARASADRELFHAFMGFHDRHDGTKVYAINSQFPD